MSLDAPESNEAHNLDDVNSRLYRRDMANRKMKHIDSLHSQHFSIKKDWTTEEAPPKAEPAPVKAAKIRHSSPFRKFFYYSLGFAGLALVVALIVFFSGGNTISTNSIDINVLGNSFASGGDELPLQVEVVNKNDGPLQLADLFIDYDKGGDASGGATHVHQLTSIGTIDAGKTATETFSVTMFGEQGSVKDITFTLQYHLAGSNAVFVKTTVFPVTINSAPVSLSVDAPATITPNQELTFTIKTVSNSKDTLSGLLLHVDYPTGFNFEKSVPAANSLNNTWDLGDLAPGAERDVVVTGTVLGQDGEDRAFHIYTGSASADDATQIGITYNSLLQTVSLVKPFLAADIEINGSDDATVPVQSSSTVNARVTYANNLPTAVTDAEVTLSIAGNALDTSNVIVPKGFYDSSTGTITWNSTTDPDLLSIEPSDNGELDFTFSVLPLITGGTALTSPSIKLGVSIKGKQADQAGVESDVTDFQNKTAVVSSDLGFSADAFYHSGAFSNTGPIPPAVNQPTTYTIVWTVTNSSNALSDGSATASLPPYVDWVGTTSPSTEAVTYDDTTHTVHWNIGAIAAGTGIGGTSRTASFQVRLNPSSSQVGTTPQLVLDTAVTATDTFTGETLSLSRAPVTTLLQNDPGFPPNGQTVTN